MSHPSLDDVAETAGELGDASGAALSDDATAEMRRSVDDRYRVSLSEE